MDGPNVKIAWNIPDNGASPILRYQVFIMASNGSLIESLAFCDGSNFVVMGNTFCEVPMQILIASPYSLIQGALIRATVTAYNVIGGSVTSTLNSLGQLAQVAPLKPPTSPQRDPSTSQSILMVDYSMLTGVYTGGSTIVSL
jgi:hypothetical protein